MKMERKSWKGVFCFSFQNNKDANFGTQRTVSKKTFVLKPEDYHLHPMYFDLS
jgi:hypothetical protein